jgi:hypothetical protein
VPVLDQRIVSILDAICSVEELSLLVSDRRVSLLLYRALQECDVVLPVQVQEHTISDCRRVVVDAGFTVTKPVICDKHQPRAFDDQPPTFGPDTQQGKMLAAFYHAGSNGLTDDVAAEEAGLGSGVASSPWRRATTLRHLGLIDIVIDDEGQPLTRPGLRGAHRIVSAVTEDGKRYVERMMT